jgi:parallel beta-helix repeat protein
MPIPPAAFLSYVRLEDQHEEGRITQLKQRLEGEVRVHTGWREFRIFQDRTDIHWGEEWQARLDEAIEAVTFFIPILTPLYFRSDACRNELEQFLAREKALGRGDLVLPIYYVDAPVLNDPARRGRDPLAATLAARQYADWRELRFEPLTDPRPARALAGMAVQIRDALEKSHGTASPRPEHRIPRSHPTAPSGAFPERIFDQVGEPRGPSAKVEPPTHVVDAWHRGDFTTISAAIKAAKPGDRILVRPGLYQEGLIIEKPLEIIGDGPIEEIVVQAVGESALLFRATMGRVAHLTLRQMGEKWYGVDIGQGRLELEGCEIGSQSLACIAIHSGADPRLRRNRIHGGGIGVFVWGSGQGTLEDNEVFGNDCWGVGIIEGGNPVLRRNLIHGGKVAGVHVYRKGQGTLEDNEISANSSFGVVVTEQGNPTLLRNTITTNGCKAVGIREGGRGTFQNNDLRGNVLGAWDIAPDCLPHVTRKDNLE